MNYKEQRRLVAAKRRVESRMTDTPDTRTMTGAEFMRHVGTDAAKWAEAFRAAYAKFDGRSDHASTVTHYIATWFRDYAAACAVSQPVDDETNGACQPTS